MQIGFTVPVIGGPPHDVVYSLEGILFLGRVRNKLLLPDLVQELNIDL